MSKYLKVRLTIPQAEALRQAAGEILAGEGDGWTDVEWAALQRAHSALAADLKAEEGRS
jgi:hypothetical protein